MTKQQQAPRLEVSTHADMHLEPRDFLNMRENQQIYRMLTGDKERFSPGLPELKSAKGVAVLALESSRIFFEARRSCALPYVMRVSEKDIIGEVILRRRYADVRYACIGAWIAEEYEGDGRVSAAIETLVAHANLEWKLRSVVAVIQNTNARSIRLAAHLQARDTGEQVTRKSGKDAAVFNIWERVL